MNCRRFQEIVRSLAGRQLLEAETIRSAREHVGACRECAALLANETALSQAIQVWREDELEKQAPAHLEASLIESFRGAPGNRGLYRTRRGVISRWRWAVAAAVLMAALGVGYIVYRQASAPPSQTAARTPDPRFRPQDSAGGAREPFQSASAGSPASAGLTESREAAPKGPSSAKKSTRPTVALAKSAPRNSVAEASLAAASRPVAVVPRLQEAYATDFYPLAPASSYEPEFAQVIRVRVPGVELERIGFPIPLEASSRLFHADVLLGDDGNARAIRLVRASR